MSLDYVEVDFGGQPRHLRYRIRDLRDLCQAMGNVTMLELLGRLAGLDPNALITCVRYGLLHENRRLTVMQVEDLLQAHMDKHRDLSRVLTAVNEALELSGIIRRREDGPAGEAEADPPRS